MQQVINEEKKEPTLSIIKQKNNVDYHMFILGNKKLFTTKEQYDIITNDLQKNMLILSCAGSGKSTTMVCRIKFLIDNGIDPTKIILTTFNVDACENLKIKLNELFGIVPNIMLGTFDSISCKFYYKYFKQDYFVGINEYSNELLKYLNTENGIKLIKKFDYFIFDEFQDINETQFKIIKKFYDNGIKVILIGDDAQNIYQWRGSDIKYILHAKTYFPTIEIKNLSINYRSSLEIVNFANAIIKCNKDNINKIMKSYTGNSGFLPNIKTSYNLNFQSQEVVIHINNLLKNNQCNPGDIAVISRNNFPLKDIEEEFEKYNKNRTEKIKYVSLITTDKRENKPKIDQNCVTLTTICKAKGLEWEYVFLISCDDDTIPANIDPVGIQEERRLFYVAVTRAKKILQIYFSKKTLSRFIEEINPELYSFPSYNKKFFKYDNKRFHRTENNLVKVINLLTEDDICKFRNLDIIPKCVPKIVRLHEFYEYTQKIKENFLCDDFNIFLTQYIIRKIGEKYNIETCYQNFYAKTLGFSSEISLNISRNIYNLYLKYFNIINKYLHEITIDDTNEQIFKKMNGEEMKIEETEKNNVCELIRKLLYNQCNEENTISIILPEKFLPEEFFNEIKENYNIYSNKINKTDNILQEIYKISLCENICDGRRRLIYQNVFQEFQNNLTQISGEINSVIEKYFNKNIISNRIINLNMLELTGIIHIIDMDEQSIIDIHCSEDKDCDFNWILQALVKVSIIYLNNKYKNIKITQIKFYNPMRGTITIIDISKWNKHIELLKYLCQIREINDIDKNVEYYIKNIQQKDTVLTHQIDDTILKNKYMQTKQLIKQCVKDNKYNIFIKKIETISKYKNMIERMKNNQFLIPKYIILDTETTGLPSKKNINVNDEYEFLCSHDTARILQFSWGVYGEHGELIKIENHIIKPTDYKVAATHIHGITEKIANKGENFIDVLKLFENDFIKINYIIGHNIQFDVNILTNEMIRNNKKDCLEKFRKLTQICTMQECCNFVQIPKQFGTGYKYPKQEELYKKIFSKKMENAHNAMYDVLNLGDIVERLISLKILNF